MYNKGKSCFLVIGICSILCSLVFGQDQRIADSLLIIYQEDNLSGTDKLELLRNLAFNELNDPAMALKYSEELIAQASAENNFKYLFRGYSIKGNKHRLDGDLELALESFIKGAENAEKADYLAGKGSANSSIADTYSIMGNSNNAEYYYDIAIKQLRQSNDSVSIATALLNLGDEYFNSGKYDLALKKFEESGFIFKEMDYVIGTAYNLGNVGMVYAEQGKDQLAEINMNKAISILEELEDFYPIAVYLTFMSDIYRRKNDNKTALAYAQRSLSLAEQYKLKDQISDGNLKLSELYEHTGNMSESLRHYKQYITYRDSVKNIESIEQMADLRTDYEVSQKQTEVDLLNVQKGNQRYILISMSIILGLGVILLSTLFWFYRSISKEKQISENLLLNILPAETALELKQKGKVEAVKFDEITVLFTDFVQFSSIAEQVEPEQLVKSIDFYFKKFDEITTKHGLEKIKTVGDSYMCASGLPTPNPDHAISAIETAKEIINLVNNEMNAQDGLSHFEIRVGVHSGPVVAGIVGIKKWQYDIWGDTVNIASRMESKSEPGRVNLSETTYNIIKDQFPCEYRGEIEVKNRGQLKMYFLS